MKNNEVLNTIKANIENASERSAWKRGVKIYALELWERMEELIENGYYTIEDLFSAKQLNKMLLNGAPNWNEYSWGGCSLIYDGEIAERLCAPYELKRTKHGQLRPNRSEEWLDTQERALRQAAIIILNAIKKAR